MTINIGHFSIWAATKSPMIMTDVFAKLDLQTLSSLQDTAVLAVSQDSVGSSITRCWRYFVSDTDVFGKGEIQLLTGGLSGGDQPVLFLNAGSKDREVSLAEVFWEDARPGTAHHKCWDIYDLWANPTGNASALAIINGTASNSINMTAMGGSRHVYAQVPPSNSSSKVGSVEPSGTVFAKVKSHGVAMLQLRAQPTSGKKDELWFRTCAYRNKSRPLLS
jgi:alpha-galactosidase